MKGVLRYYLINLVALWATTEVLPALSYTGGIKTLGIGAVVFSVINFALVPLLKVLLLPLNLLTLGFFAWLTNVIALYALTSFIPKFKLLPYHFPGFESGGFALPAFDLTAFWVAVLASILIGLFTHFLQWLVH